MAQLPTLLTAMTPFPHSVELEATLSDAARLMLEHQVRHIPVTEDHRILGLVSDREILTAPKPGAGENGSDRPLVKDYLKHDSLIVDVGEPIEEVLSVMAERRLDAAVVTRKGRLAGVFTTVDVCAAFGRYIREAFPRPRDNDAA